MGKKTQVICKMLNCIFKGPNVSEFSIKLVCVEFKPRKYVHVSTK